MPSVGTIPPLARPRRLTPSFRSHQRSGMPVTLELERGPITYAAAAELEKNAINQLAYVPKVKELYDYLWKQRSSIEALTAHHLCLSKHDTCRVLDQHAWIRGSFNVCIPVEVKSGSASCKVIVRCPMPHKLAEARYPGTVDEKLGCEVGTYLWMQDNCPDVPIPHLFGFGFSDGRHVSPTRVIHVTVFY